MRKYITVIVARALLVGGVYTARGLINRDKKQRPEAVKVVQTAFVQTVNNKLMPVVVSESGRLVAKNRMEIYAEVQGVMESSNKEFKPGSHYKKGEVMVEIRSNDFYANLQAQKSVLQNLITSIMPDLRLDYPEAYVKWDQYLKDFDVHKPLKELPATSSEKEKFFITGKNIYTTYYNTKNQDIILLKYTLRAPFNGILTEAVVNPGTVVRPGQKLGEYIDTNLYELEVAISKQFLPSLSVGQNVTIVDPQDNTATWKGVISRINGKVDLTTQTVQVFIDLSGTELKEGMYLNAQIAGKPKENSFEVARNLLIDETKLYIVEESALRAVSVEVVHKSDKSVIVQGLSDGMLVITKPIPGSYSGMEVTINQTE